MNSENGRDRRYHLEEVGVGKWVLTCEGTDEKLEVNHPWAAIDAMERKRDGEIVEVLTLADKRLRSAG